MLAIRADLLHGIGAHHARRVHDRSTFAREQFRVDLVVIQLSIVHRDLQSQRIDQLDLRAQEHAIGILAQVCDLFLRLAEVGRIANLPEVLLKYRRHPESVSHQKYENQWKLKKQIVAEAYDRRGMKMPADWTFTPWKPKPVVAQLKEWAWMALKAGKIAAARKHAMSVFKKAPLSADSWRLMFCAIRGR